MPDRVRARGTPMPYTTVRPEDALATLLTPEFCILYSALDIQAIWRILIGQMAHTQRGLKNGTR